MVQSLFQKKENFAFTLEIRLLQSVQALNPRCLKSSVKFLQSARNWSARSSAEVGGGQSTVFCQSQYSCLQEDSEQFMLPSAVMLYRDANFVFQQDLAPAHSAKSTTKWFADHDIAVLDWPANSSDVSLRESVGYSPGKR